MSDVVHELFDYPLSMIGMVNDFPAVPVHVVQREPCVVSSMVTDATMAGYASSV